MKRLISAMIGLFALPLFAANSTPNGFTDNYEIELKGVAKEGDFTGSWPTEARVTYTTISTPLPKILFR